MMDKLFFETKLLADDAGFVSGLAWKYATPDRMGDMIEPAAFTKTAFPLPMLFGHDLSEPLGTWDEAADREGGYFLKGRLLVDDVARAREVRALVRSGAVRGLSIGFNTKKANARPGGGRTITQLELLEVSLVTIPMHPSARVTSAKSAVEALNLVAAINRAVTALRP